MSRVRVFPLFSFLLLALSACGAKATSPPPPPPCDEKCKDETTMRALRETMKLGFNLTLQGKPVGTHDVSGPCPLGGKARIFGSASSNAIQGSTDVDLTYVLEGCEYLVEDDDAKENYRMKFTGTITQKGTLAVQPTATTAVVMRSESMAMIGTVYAPPVNVDLTCPVLLGQDGNKLTGTLCGRAFGVDL
jgi:hypothetical protein